MNKLHLQRIAGALSVWSTLGRWWRALWGRPGRTWGGWALVVLLLGSLVGPAAPAAEAVDVPRALPHLLQETGREPNKTFRVIVTRQHRSSAADDAVVRAGGRKLKEVASVGFVAELKGQALAALARSPAVKWITPDAVMVPTGKVEDDQLATLYPQVVKAADLWDNGTGITGTSVGVAVLDTGISPKDDFRTGQPGPGTRVVAQAKFNSATNSMSDGYGHGTHVAGIVGGNSWWQRDSSVRGKYVGVAPEANLVNVKVSDDQGTSYISDVIAGIEWVIANRAQYNIRVLNLSLISSVAESYLTSPLAASVERAWFNGILVVVAAGNLGPDSVYYPPANDPFVVTVGAADPVGTLTRDDDTIAPWSSYGTSQDGIAKPDVVAPGRYIVSTLASTGSTLGKSYPDRIVDSSYLRLSGTSMAAPVVAGIAALALQVHPEWTNDQVKWLLLNRSTRLFGKEKDPATGKEVPLPGQGGGLVHAKDVVECSCTPGSANQGLTISNLLVGPGGATIYSTGIVSPTTSTWSTSTWSTSTWSTSTWSTSTWSTSTWSTSTWSTSTWSTSSWSSAGSSRGLVD